MCRPVQCKNCQKTTWAGCGQHVNQVKQTVPSGQWCTCTQEEKDQAKGPSLFSKIFGSRS